MKKVGKRFCRISSDKIRRKYSKRLKYRKNSVANRVFF